MTPNAAKGTSVLRPLPSLHGASSLLSAVALLAVALLSAPTSLAADEATATGRPSGLVEPHSAAALPKQRSESPARDAWPAWRRALKAWEWYNITGTSLSSAKPPSSIPGNPATRIGAWNGLAADIRTNRLFSAANGGHADYAGNEVCEIDLSAEEPRWRFLRGPTAAEDILASSGAKKQFNDYYRDGRPASTHTYYALQFLATRNAIFKFGAGSLWGSGNEANWKTDAFSLANLDWHPAGTWPDIVPDSRKNVIGRSVCLNPKTDEVYIAASVDLRRFDPKRGEYDVLARWPESSYAVYARSCAVDTDRNRVVFFGDAYRKLGGYVYDVDTKNLERIRFSGPLAAEIVKKEHNFAWYDPSGKRFLLKTKDADAVYAIDPTSFAVSRVETIGGKDVPNATNGVHTRWQRMPNLGGYAYYPAYRSGVWFLATE